MLADELALWSGVVKAAQHQGGMKPASVAELHRHVPSRYAG